MTDVQTVVVSIVGAILAAYITAAFTLRGAREQSIETERLRLVHSIVQRRLAEFDERVRRFRAEICLEGTVSEVIGSIRRSNAATLSQEVAHSAIFVGPRYEAGIRQQWGVEFVESVQALAEAADELARVRAPEDAVAERLEEESRNVLAHLDALEWRVDMAAENRLREWRPRDRPPKTVYPLRVYGMKTRGEGTVPP